jgi:transcriptional regulator with XRE-family HTH domain
MNMSVSIGEKVKEHRQEKKMTIKQLSEESGLSIGYLSQFERGLSAIAIDSLESVAKALGISVTSLVSESSMEGEDAQEIDPVMHGVELVPRPVSPQIYQHTLCHNKTDFSMLPRMFILLPFSEEAEIPELYAHKGEEFIYVLEGVVTVFLEDRKYVLYPGDSMMFDSGKRHNWMNRTSRIAKILTVNTRK